MFALTTFVTLQIEYLTRAKVSIKWMLALAKGKLDALIHRAIKTFWVTN